MDCECVSCRGRRSIRRARTSLAGTVQRKKKGAVQAVLLLLSLAIIGVSVVDSVPTERERWFGELLRLAQTADATYEETLDQDGIAWEPYTREELDDLVLEIVFQINEENASDQIIMPASVNPRYYPPLRRSGVAGSYNPEAMEVYLNSRFFTTAWGSRSYLSTLTHELVHAQGFLNETQTEITALEVVAAMANLDFPGMRADILLDLRGHALAMAYYIARFEGGPIDTTFDLGGFPALGLSAEAPEWDVDAGMVFLWQQARKDILSPDELARSDKRIRWWEERPAEYRQVLRAYTVPVMTMILGQGCGDQVLDEQFHRYVAVEGPWHMEADENGKNHRVDTLGWAPTPKQMPNLRIDDLGYLLDDLSYC